MLSPLDNSELGRQQDGAIGNRIDGEAVNFSEIIAIIRRQYRVVVVGIIVGCLIGGAYLVTAAPKYTATTALLIDSKKGSESVMSNGAIADLTIDSSAIDSQVEILRSEKIANAVIEDLRLIPSEEQGLKPYNLTFLDELRNVFSLSWWVGSGEKTEQEKQRSASAAQLSYLQRNLAAIMHRTGSSGMGASRFPLRVVSGHALAPPAEEGGAWDDWFGVLRTKGSCRGHIAPSVM